MHGGKHPKVAQICTEFPTLIEPSVTHRHACASTHVDILRASKALDQCLLAWTTAPCLTVAVLVRAQSYDVR